MRAQTEALRVARQRIRFPGVRHILYSYGQSRCDRRRKQIDTFEAAVTGKVTFKLSSRRACYTVQENQNQLERRDKLYLSCDSVTHEYQLICK